MNKNFITPTITEISDYLIGEKKYEQSIAENFAERFWNFYESKGWTVGKSKMKNWKAAIRTWELKSTSNGTHNQSTGKDKAGTSAARINAARKF